MQHHALVIVDAAGVIRHWNTAAALAFGHGEAEALGRTLDLIVPEPYRPQHWAGFRRAMASASAAAEGNPGPFPVLCADGEIRAVQGRLTLLRSAEGKAIGATVVFG